MKKRWDHPALSWVCLIVWCGIIFYLSSRPDYGAKTSELPELLSRKVAHVVEYAVLALLAWRAGRTLTFSLRARAVGVMIFCVTYASSDEIHQSFVPGRYGKARDVVLDSLGALWATAVLVRRERKGIPHEKFYRLPVV